MTKIEYQKVKQSFMKFLSLRSLKRKLHSKPFQMDHSLVGLLDGHNRITRPLGVNIAKKVQGKFNFRLYLFLAILWSDWIYTVAISFIPTENEELLMVLGDFSYHLVDKNRYFMTMGLLAIRSNSTFMVTIFALDRFDWLRHANVVFDQLKSQALIGRLSALRKRCQLAAWISGFILSSIAVAAHVMSTVIYRKRNELYDLRWTHVYIGWYDCTYTMVNSQFMIELYFLCNVCMEVFSEINHQFALEMDTKHHGRFGINYARFGKACILTHHLISYARKLYICIFICNSTIIVFVLYSAMYANSNLFQQAIYVSYLGMNLFFIVFFSHVIGLVDVRAKAVSDKIYEEFIMGQRVNKWTKYFYWQLLRYFQSVWSSVISMEIMGNAINSSTSIMILTILLTIFAFLVGNFNIHVNA